MRVRGLAVGVIATCAFWVVGLAATATAATPPAATGAPVVVVVVVELSLVAPPVQLPLCLSCLLPF